MRKVVIVGPPPVQVLDVTGPLEVFSNAPGYEIQLATPGLDRTLQTNRSLVLADATPIAEVQGPIDTLVIAGGPGAESGTYDSNFIAWIAKAARREGAIFGVWEAKRGLFPLGGSACRLPRQIPYTQAMDILLTCRGIPAIEAQQMGLIGRVVPDGAALEVARTIAQQVARNAPLSTMAILRAWRETEHMSDADAMQYQDKIGWEVFASEDAQEGPKAFGEKRPPVYKGK